MHVHKYTHVPGRKWTNWEHPSAQCRIYTVKGIFIDLRNDVSALVYASKCLCNQSVPTLEAL